MIDFEWRDVPGHPGYQVSNYGQVKSLSRVISRRNNSDRLVPACILRPAASRSGHLSVVLGRGKTKQVHALVMSAFVGPRPDGMEILHLDHNPRNNTLRNLKYGTRSENIKMDYESGSKRLARVVEVIHADGSKFGFKSITEAGKAYGMTQPTASISAKNGSLNRKHKVRIVYVD